MKVIDLLNKIANGEEVPKKILYKYQNKDFYEEYRLKWNKKYEAYYTTKDNTPITHLLADNLWNLNDEVEIIEEDKKIEKMIPLNNVSGASDLVAISQMQWENNLKIERKINEIIDYLEENKKC